jgi:cardiolipin synthase
MKRAFVIFALGVFAAFVYTISAMQYNYINNVIQVFSGNVFGFIVSGILGLIALIIIIRVLLKEDYAYNKSYWLLIIVLNPILGIILYGIFARDFQLRKFPKTRPLIYHKAFLGYEKKSLELPYEGQFSNIFSFIEKTTSRSIYQDNTTVELLNNGDRFFPKLEEELKKAKHYILMEFYILKTDQIGKRILDILADQARKGLKVRLLYDHFGSNKFIEADYMNRLKAAGVKISIFDPQTLSVFNSNLNFRNHRKVTVIDGETGFIGGMNLGDEYNHQSEKFGFWRDTQVMLKGRGVIGLYNIFIKDWYYVTNQVLDFYRNPKPQYQNGVVSLIESGPDYEEGLIKDVYLKMISSAKESIKITTPYLILEPEMMAAIRLASNSGVTIQLMVPGLHDYFTVGYATKSYYESLLKMGVEIYEYTNRFIHAKTLIVDDAIASVGTVNLDPRSLNLNFEATAIFENSTVKDMVDTFNEDLKISTKINAEEWRKRGIFTRIAQAWFNLFSPMF